MVTETDVIGRIVNIIIVLGGAFTAILAAVITAKKTIRETDAKIRLEDETLKIAKKELDLKEDREKTDLTDRLQLLYEKMTSDFDKKFCSMQVELDQMKKAYDLLKEELEKSQNREKMKTKAGVLLIKAIEKSLELRKEHSNDPTVCQACVISDQELMKTLDEVRILFQNGY